MTMQYETRFLCTAYFPCDSCHRPIVQFFESSWLPSVDEWAARPFNLHCLACGWGAEGHAGRFAIHTHVYEWPSEVLGLPVKRPA